jgi:hypothetical protein
MRRFITCSFVTSLACLIPAGARADIIVQGDVAPPIPANGKVMGDLSVGVMNNGSLEVNGGSVLDVSQDLLNAVGLMAQGSTTLKGAGSQIKVGHDSVVGLSSTGGFTHNDGTHTVGQDLVLARGFQAVGTYSLTGGSLSVTNASFVGHGNVGTFTQSGGTHETGNLVAGAQSGSDGTYHLSAGTLTIRGSGQSTIGQSGTGTFNQTGGTHTSDLVVVGDARDSDGTYTLEDGRLSTRETIVGKEGGGTFNHEGGRHEPTMDLTLGSAKRGSGQYNLTGGGVLDVGDQTTVGDEGFGEFFLFGGTHTNRGNLVLANNAGSTGNYEASSGTLDVRGTTIVGQAGTGEYFQAGATATMGGLVVADAGTGKVSVTAVGELTVNGDVDVGTSTGDGTLDVFGGGKLTATGTIRIGGVDMNLKGEGRASVTGAGTVLKANTMEVGGTNAPLMVTNSGNLEVGGGGQVDATVNVNPTGTLTGQMGVKDFKKKVNNNGGKVAAAPGAFNIDGGYAQADTGIMEILFVGDGMGGADWGTFFITGATQFAMGTSIDFNFSNFLPKVGDMFEFLTSTDLMVAPADDNIALGVFKSKASGVVNFQYEIKSTDRSLILVSLSNAQVPEPSGLVLAGLGLVSLAFVSWRRAPGPRKAKCLTLTPRGRGSN